MALIAISMLSVSALADTGIFSFTFAHTGTVCSSPVQKTNSKSFATVRVASAPSGHVYKYAVSKELYTGYVTPWKTHTGTGEFNLNYTSQLAPGTNLRLCGATVSNSGTSNVSGTWTP